MSTRPYHTKIRQPVTQKVTQGKYRKLPYIFDREARFEEKFLSLVEESDPDHTVYIYRYENHQVIKPYIYKGHMFPDIVNAMQDYIGEGDYAVFIRDAEKMNILRDQLKRSGLQWIEEENICSNVIQAIEAEDDVKKARIEKLFPPKWQKLFGEFAGVVGSKFYTKLKCGTKVYHRFVLKKAI